MTKGEWLTFFFLPFFTSNTVGKENLFTQSEMDRFEKHGFHKKAEQAKMVKAMGGLFWVIVGFIILFILASQ
ncbi:hypothetical protein POV27_12140 [Aureisphaera galaxeae]|uniref:hypothetical protein n=1 Tax=Aureisphaera galaxeae TaxID=1538023 RepID=UPI00234FB87B|nr:hypothetical protein [Aureisphaera galaxeae]MDC8004805.1 hypothetical protein [Aureisphaera galaxeae]